ncbi:hypothetical protein GCM10023085_77810 [Actinomadura viridis]|uniref:Uncharacterized protein n=1 Tax=Actinomadura viridis TaxID=58110 RepID=A0A931GKG5_9ACTN|nr:hypothetical protein [Actinomadura viridis]MBG6090317.1 hypothetical protein [Actinomadura viridis]
MNGRRSEGLAGPGPDPTGAWIHAFEEDTPDAAVYRPAEHPFRPARRPRRRLEFRADGTFAERRPGPDDRLYEIRGRWERQGPGRIAVSFPGGGGTAFGITVLSRSGDRLEVAR